MPISRGANGLNLVEASHILLVSQTIFLNNPFLCETHTVSDILQCVEDFMWKDVLLVSQTIFSNIPKSKEMKFTFRWSHFWTQLKSSRLLAEFTELARKRPRVFTGRQTTTNWFIGQLQIGVKDNYKLVWTITWVLCYHEYQDDVDKGWSGFGRCCWSRKTGLQDDNNRENGDI